MLVAFCWLLLPEFFLQGGPDVRLDTPVYERYIVAITLVRVAAVE
jgi:hypothetical protein